MQHLQVDLFDIECGGFLLWNFQFLLNAVLSKVFNEPCALNNKLHFLHPVNSSLFFPKSFSCNANSGNNTAFNTEADVRMANANRLGFCTFYSDFLRAEHLSPNHFSRRAHYAITTFDWSTCHEMHFHCVQWSYYQVASASSLKIFLSPGNFEMFNKT